MSAKHCFKPAAPTLGDLLKLEDSSDGACRLWFANGHYCAEWTSKDCSFAVTALTLEGAIQKLIGRARR